MDLKDNQLAPVRKLTREESFAASIESGNFAKVFRHTLAEANAALSWDGVIKDNYSYYYDKDSITSIIESGEKTNRASLSKYFFLKNGFYKRIITYYSNLLKYDYVLIPNFKKEENLSNENVLKRYNNALERMDNLNIKALCQHFARKVLINGSYYGIIQRGEGTQFCIQDLPSKYCRSRYKNYDDVPIVEINLSFFDVIKSAKIKQELLDSYPENIKIAYESYKKGADRWCAIPDELGIYFKLYDDNPYFLNIIPQIVDFEEYKELEKKKYRKKMRTLLVQQMPIEKETPIFEPEEIADMHAGSVAMCKNMEGMDVLTTYAKVDAIDFNEKNGLTDNTISNMEKTIFSEAGVSRQIFATDGNLSLGVSLKHDLALMMDLANQFSSFFSFLTNYYFSNSQIDFKIKFLPISFYNQDDYIKSTLSLAQSGYSFLIPAIASGVSQRDLRNIKILENKILSLQDMLVPLQSSFGAQNGKDGNTSTTNGKTASLGRPAKPDEKKSERTLQNISSKEGGKK